MRTETRSNELESKELKHIWPDDGEDAQHDHSTHDRGQDWVFFCKFDSELWDLLCLLKSGIEGLFEWLAEVRDHFDLAFQPKEKLLGHSSLEVVPPTRFADLVVNVHAELLWRALRTFCYELEFLESGFFLDTNWMVLVSFCELLEYRNMAGLRRFVAATTAALRECSEHYVTIGTRSVYGLRCCEE